MTWSWTALLVVLASSLAHSQTVLDVRREFALEKEEDLKGGYIAAIVLLSILAIILAVILVALGISNQRYFASKALESEEESDEEDGEMQNVLEGGAEEEEEDIEEDVDTQ